MALYAISDLHLAYGVKKPMDIFGPRWEGYMGRLEKSWLEIVKPDDTVIIPGDISWAINLKELEKDISFINSLPGKKIISKGNHDYWWETMNKIRRFVVENGYDSVEFLHNNCFEVEGKYVCGTRGWISPEDENFEPEDEKIYAREVGRLKRSLDCIVTSSDNGIGYNSSVQKRKQIIVALHYPPFNPDGSSTEIIEVMEQAGVERCVYGHLHGESCDKAYQGLRNGILYQLVSADYLAFSPLLLD